MKERPIIFNTEMVRAILENRKSVTRRVIKPDIVGNMDIPRGQGDVDAGYPYIETENGMMSVKDLCPYGKPGDLLWVRETWAKNIPGCEEQGGYSYRADHITGNDGPTEIKWIPSIHMPKTAARLWLELTDVRVERVQDISEEDARAEGCESYVTLDASNGLPTDCKTAKELFIDLWNSINAKRGYGWDVNPWVWVIEFRRIGR